jgi:metal-sulfur cluster biosynthetic enzyme
MSAVEPVSIESIRGALTKCIDPELGLDIITLGLVYEIRVDPSMVTVIMTLTTPGCPLAPYFEQRVRELVTAAAPHHQLTLTFTFDPPWSPAKLSPEAKRRLTMLRG